MQTLVAQGRIGRWGVSNFDTDDMQELWALPYGPVCATNQVYYSLSERGAGFSLLPWQRAQGVRLMAYSHIDQGALSDNQALEALAELHGAAGHVVRSGAHWRRWVNRFPGPD